MSKFSFFRLFSIFFFLFLLTLASTSVAFGAAALSLSPTSGGGAAGATFTVDVKLDTGGVAVTGVDGVVTFNAAVLEVSGFVYKSLFTNQPQPTIDNATGRLVFHPAVINAVDAYTSPSGNPGTLATITFKGRVAGTSAVSFFCTPGTTLDDSNVWQSGSDIINCSSNVGGSYTITASSGGGTGPTSTPTPTGTGGGTSLTLTPTPAELLNAGTTEWTYLFTALGIFFLLSGVKILLAKPV